MYNVDVADGSIMEGRRLQPVRKRMLIKPPSRTDLDDAYAAVGCPVCSLLTRSERRYIDATLYEHVTDVKWRSEVRAARGFCALHAQHVLTASRSALGVSLVTADILKTLRETLPTTVGGGGALGRLRSAFSGGDASGGVRPQQRCPICTYINELGAVYIASLLDDVTTERGHTAYSRSVGLCLPHLVAAMDRGGPGLATVTAHQAVAWERLETELNEFIRKNDYQWSGEPVGAERDAWRRALLLLSGEH
jgi:hypothetical protein